MDHGGGAFIDYVEVAEATERRRPGGSRGPARRDPRARAAFAAAALTALLIPLAAGAQDGGGAESGVTTLDAPTRISGSFDDDYSFRARNTGRGGAARLSCRDADRCLFVRNAGGPAARFIGDEDAPPFEVGSRVRVNNLNADLLDGRTASQIVEDAIELSGGGGAPTGPAGGDLTGVYPDPEIAANAVGSAEIATGAVGPAEIADGSITQAEVAPANVDGSAATPSLRTLGTGAGQAAAGDDPRFSDSRPPTGAAGGDLAGAYPDPTLAAGSIDSTSLFSSPLLDGAAGTATLRSLGTGANQAAAGNDPRLSDARTPTGPAGGDLTGTYPDPTLADGSVDSATVEDASLRLHDTAVLSSAVNIEPFPLAANSCITLVGASGDIQAGDVVVPYPPVDGTDNQLGVVWTSGTHPGDGTITFLACNHTTSTLSAGGSIPVYVFRP